RLTAPRIDITPDKASGEAITLELKQKGPQRSTEASVKLGGVQGSAKALTVPSINATVALSGPDMPKAFKATITGSARADLEKQTMNAELSSKIDESTIQAKVG